MKIVGTSLIPGYTGKDSVEISPQKFALQKLFLHFRLWFGQTSKSPYFADTELIRFGFQRDSHGKLSGEPVESLLFLRECGKLLDKTF